MIQGIVTALLIVIFLAGSAWLWSSKRKPALDAAARLALDDEAERPSRPRDNF